MSPDGLEVPERVVEQVAANTGRDPDELPHLYDCVDPDALDKLIAQMVEGHVQFSYAGQTVTVNSEGNVDVTETLSATEASSSALGLTD